MKIFENNIRYKGVLCILIFLLLPLVFFWDGNLPPNLIENGDGLFYYLSEQITSAKIMKTGELPLWDPYRFSGFPFIGDLEAGCLYPPNLLFLVLPPKMAFNWIMYLHYSIAGILTFWYVRSLGMCHISSLFSGIVYMFSGFLVAHMGHVNLQNTAVWVPLVFLCIDKIRQGNVSFYLPLGISAIALQILASFFQGGLYTILYVLIYIGFFIIIENDRDVRRRLILNGTLMILGAVLLTLVQIMPTFELSLLTPRKEIDYKFFVSHSLEPRLLPIFIFPNLFGGNSYQFYPIYYWGNWNLVEMTGYCGILTLCLACICFLSFRKNSHHVIFWSIVAVIAFCLSFGKYNPIYKLLYFIPVYNLFRCPARHLFMFDFSLAVLGGICLDFISKPGILNKIRRSFNLTIVYGVLVCVAAIAFIIKSQIFNHSVSEILSYNFSFRNPAIYIPLLTIGMTLGFLFLLRNGNPSRVLFGLAPFLVFLDLFFFGHFFNPIQEKAGYFNKVMGNYDSVKYLLAQDDVHSYRILSMPSTHHLRTNTDEMLNTLFPNSNSLCDIKSVNGNSSFILDDYSRLLGMSEGGLADFDWLLDNNHVISMLNVKYILSNVHQPDKIILNNAGSRENAIFLKWVDLKPNTAYKVYFDIETDNIDKGQLLIRILGNDLGGYSVVNWMIPVEGGIKKVDREFRTSVLWTDEFYLKISNLSPNPIIITKLSLIEIENGRNILFPSRYTSIDLVSDGRYVKKFEKGYLSIFENTKALPKFNLLSKIRLVQDTNEAINILRYNTESPDLGKEALVECRNVPLILEEGSSGWSVVRSRYNETIIRTSSVGNKLLVISESYYPGWRAYIDGKEDKIFRVNGIIQGVFVPNGTHIIRMVYDPLSFKIGLIISGLAWIGLTIYFIIIFWRKRCV